MGSTNSTILLVVGLGCIVVLIGAIIGLVGGGGRSARPSKSALPWGIIIQFAIAAAIISFVLYFV